MIRIVLLSLLSTAVAGRVANAQSIGQFPAAGNPAPEVRRLPPVEVIPTPDPVGALPTVEQELPSPPTEERITQAEPKKPIDPWEGSVEFGLDGTDGNSESFNLRFGGHAKRKVPCRALTLDLDYHKGTRNSIPSAHRLFLEGRQEWLWEESPWTYYVHGTSEYDEFRPFDLRLALDSGVGYRLVETDDTEMTGRLGGGVSHELDAPEEVYVPELVFGLDLEHQFSKRQKVTATIDYMPDVTDFGDFRLNTKAGWEALIDEEMNLSLKLGVKNRYDSTPNGAKPNDVDYSAVLLWKF